MKCTEKGTFYHKKVIPIKIIQFMVFQVVAILGSFHIITNTRFINTRGKKVPNDAFTIITIIIQDGPKNVSNA